ncbi:MAG: TonB-dependent receptor [Candidatus Marinimicrobia bacterium]|jgi:outer membrane cobalamin receptor|nr:TonB-dependent receptor [Candidatus Neomarinimicrobiota bacterium]MBT3944018.1 TonB-dependent receptor [Candidatus Neomarinimicrobiota bacterium]MBT4111742.1 TonB-dependent receptor [Candidatus Neomarinimicrobiota bacterium]MBT4706940.1 TonB-dependent receptor [Candidatus Neomarinimicrobiota bacterium]MBT4926546.1 TonB-dependent receptor [Candidatus Neomarinimicrobiota bacterium]
MKQFILTLFFMSIVFAQSTITGLVIDQDTGLPLKDANVSVVDDSGTSIAGTSTDDDGKFELSLSEARKVQVSVIGYENATADVVFNQSMIFNLVSEAISFEGVRVFSSLRKVNEGDLATSAIIFNDELQVKQGQHFSDLIQKVPNLNYAGGTSRPKYFQIRGEGSVSRYADQGPPSTYVGLVLDGMDLSELGMITPLFDMQQVEVLMGVQTSLFGASASSGLINFKTNDPTDKQEGYVMTQFGSYNTLTNGIVYNTPLLNGWKLRLVGHSNVSDGYKDNVASGIDYASANRDETSFRAKLLKTGDNNITQKYTMIYSDFDNGYDNWAPDNNTDNITYSDNPGKDSQKSQIFIADYSYDLDEGFAELNVGVSNNETLHSYDSDWGNYQFWFQDPYNFDPAVEGYQYDFFDSFDRDIDTRTVDFRLRSNTANDNKVDYVMGLYQSNYEEKTNADGYIFGGSSTGLASAYDIITKSAYGELAFNFKNDSSVSLAFRSEARDLTYNDFNDKSASFDMMGDFENSYKIAYEFHPTPTLHWFAYYAEGYHPAGINQNPYLDADEKTYDAETYFDITTGIRWYTDNIKLSSSLFYLEHDDHIYETSEQLDPMNPNAFAFFKTNAESGYEYGSESTGEFRITDKFTINATLGLLSSEIELGGHDEHGDEHGDDDHDDDHGDDDHDEHGDEHEGHEHGKKAHSPNWNYSLSFNYDFTVNNSLMIEISGKDGFVFDSAHDEYESEPYHLLNAYYNHSINQFDLGFYAKNILDESYADRGFILGLEPPIYEEKLYKSFGPPREIGMSLTYSF